MTNKMREEELLRNEALKKEYLALLAYENDLKKKKTGKHGRNENKTRSPSQEGRPMNRDVMADESFGIHIDSRSKASRSPGH